MIDTNGAIKKKSIPVQIITGGGKGTGKLVQSFQLLKQVGHLRVNTENGIQTVKYYIFKYAIEKTRYD